MGKMEQMNASQCVSGLGGLPRPRTLALARACVTRAAHLAGCQRVHAPRTGLGDAHCSAVLCGITVSGVLPCELSQSI